MARFREQMGAVAKRLHVMWLPGFFHSMLPGDQYVHIYHPSKSTETFSKGPLATEAMTSAISILPSERHFGKGD